jgi:hypothetical protein
MRITRSAELATTVVTLANCERETRMAPCTEFGPDEPVHYSRDADVSGVIQPTTRFLQFQPL